MTGMQFVIKNILLKKLRLVLLVVAIAVAFLIYGTLGSLHYSFNQPAREAAKTRLVVTHKINFTMSLPVAYVNRVRQVKGVIAATQLNWFGAYYKEEKNQWVTFATVPENFFKVYGSLGVTDEEQKNFIENRQAMLIGADLAERFGLKKGMRIPLNSNIYIHKDGQKSWKFDIVGIIREPDAPERRASYFHYDYFNESVTFDRDNAGLIAARTKEVGLNDVIMERIDRMFANSSAETLTRTQQEFNASFANQLGDLEKIIQLVVAAAFVTILLIAGNTQVMSVRERTREIGVLKALGYSNSRITTFVVAEGLVISMAGWAFGMLFYWIMMEVLKELLKEQSFSVYLHVVGSSLGWALLLGVVTSLIPAWMALRLTIIKALGRV